MNSQEKPLQRRLMVIGIDSPNQTEVIARVAKRKNWQPIYWFYQQKNRKSKIVEQFPDCECLWVRDMVRRRLPSSVPSRDWPLRDVNVIRQFTRHDPVLYPVFLREARYRSGMDQLAEYQELVTFWYYFFEYAAPDIIIFNKIPAHMHDVVAYLMARERDIPMLFLIPQVNTPGIWLPAANYEEPPPRVAARYEHLLASDIEFELSDNGQQLLDRMSGSYTDAMYNNFRQRYAMDKKQLLVKPRNTIPRKLYNLMLGRYSAYQARVLAREIVTSPARLRLRWSYERQTVWPDFESNYIFVPLHVQPERSSIPQGGIFGQQLLMIEILSRTLPEGWKLYVKEHPVQLYDTPTQHHQFRTPNLYREIRRFSNVQLVPSRLSAHKMIEHCFAVAAVTSNTCWEALFKGKPSLIFGHVWYSFCQGIFTVHDEEQCAATIDHIRKEYNIEHRHLRACLRAVEDEGLPKPPPLDGHHKTEWTAWLESFDRQIETNGRIRSLP